MLYHKIKATLKNIQKKILLWVTGFSLYYIFTWLYDYILVSFLIWEFGIIKGGIFVVVLSTLVDLATMKFYDWLKKDWLALETIKDLENQQGFVPKVFRYIHDKTVVVTVIVLSIFTNPFVATAYMRKGAYKYNGMEKRDWIIFISGVLVSSFSWVIIVGGVVETIKIVANFFNFNFNI